MTKEEVLNDIQFGSMAAKEIVTSLEAVYQHLADGGSLGKVRWALVNIHASLGDMRVGVRDLIEGSIPEDDK